MLFLAQLLRCCVILLDLLERELDLIVLLRAAAHRDEDDARDDGQRKAKPNVGRHVLGRRLRQGVEHLRQEGLLLHCLFGRGRRGQGLLSAKAQREEVRFLQPVAAASEDLSAGFHNINACQSVSIVSKIQFLSLYFFC